MKRTIALAVGKTNQKKVLCRIKHLSIKNLGIEGLIAPNFILY